MKIPEYGPMRERLLYMRLCKYCSLEVYPVGGEWVRIYDGLKDSVVCLGTKEVRRVHRVAQRGEL